MAGEKEVQVVESCFITPSADTPRKALRLSLIDFMLASGGYTPLVHFYRRRHAVADDFFDVTRLKTALGKALVAFYPMAGRFRVNADGRLEIDCNGKGMLFVVAHSRLTVDDFSDFKPSPKLRRLLVPHVDESAGLLCATQVRLILLISLFSNQIILPVTDMRVVSWLGMPLYDVDFSWGKPLAMLLAESNRRGYVLMIGSAQGDGSLRIVMCIEAPILQEFRRLFYAKFESMVHSKF